MPNLTSLQLYYVHPPPSEIGMAALAGCMCSTDDDHDVDAHDSVTAAVQRPPKSNRSPIRRLRLAHYFTKHYPAALLHHIAHHVRTLELLELAQANVMNLTRAPGVDSDSDSDDDEQVIVPRCTCGYDDTQSTSSVIHATVCPRMWYDRSMISIIMTVMLPLLEQLHVRVSVLNGHSHGVEALRSHIDQYLLADRIEIVNYQSFAWARH